MGVVTAGVAILAAGAAFGDSEIAPHGSGAGAVLEPARLGVDPSNGNLYVADLGNRRVDAFDSGGAFLRAFGWGDVASGSNNNPKNEVQKVEVLATGGLFNLLFIQNGEEPVGSLIKQETGAIPFDASAEAVQGALEGLAAFGPGDVTVSGPAGGPWTFEFTGVFADTDLHQFEEGSVKELTGGAQELGISTLQDGGNYEVCEAGEACRAGQRGVKTGQSNPFSVAVDSSHDVYVYDGLESSSRNEAPNNRVEKFSSEGDFIYMLGGGVDLDTGEDVCTTASGDECGRGKKGGGTGEFNDAHGSVAVGPGDDLYVNDGGRVQKFAASGAFIEAISLPGTDSTSLAVDSAGSIYSAETAEVRKYGPTGAFLYGLPASNLGAIAVDGSDRLYASDLNSGRFGISRYDATGSPEAVFYSLKGSRATGLAPASGGVYTVEENVLNLVPTPPPGPVVYPDLSTIRADPIGNVKATLHTEVNPEGNPTTFHYQYVDQNSFDAHGWASSNVQSSTESSSIGPDFTLHDAATQVTGLTPSTVYHFRVVATNSDAPAGITGPEQTFKTEPPVSFGPLWTTEVGNASAVLHAEVNPRGFAATGYFEYVDDASYQVSGFSAASQVPAPSSPFDLGEGEAFVEQSAEAAPLAPGTTYHYRLVASDHCKPSEPSVLCTFQSDARTFHTFPPPEPSPTVCAGNRGFRQGLGEFLSDCRAWEMVSPIDKNGVNLEAAFRSDGFRAGLDQSALDGNEITFSAYRAFAEPEGAPYSSQYISGRTSEGWKTKSISPPREGPSLLEGTEGLDAQFKGFSSDLCSGWALQDTRPKLSAEAVTGYANLYRRDDCEPDAGAYQASITATPTGSPAPPSVQPELEGFSADGSKTFFRVAAKLTSKSRQGIPQVYEVSGGGAPNPVCVLPSSSITLTGCTLGYMGNGGTGIDTNLATAVSDDGSVAYWTDRPSVPREGPLYVRVNGSETFQVSAESASFWAAAADGSAAVYTINQKLFEYDLASKTSTLLAEGVIGFAGASRDLTQLYLVSVQPLAAGAEAGKLNLYRYAAGNFRLIAILASGDGQGLTNRPSPINERPGLRTSRVTPDGDHFVFMSQAALTGYDNADAATGQPDSEVYLYDATANGGAGLLRCVSCNPAGQRPEGQVWEIPQKENIRAAAFIPGWESGLYAPRVVADDGSRVFFTSFGPLTLHDSNEAQDVYEWEKAGSGDCTEGGYGYVASSGGCVTLISSGQSPQNSEFVDSTPSGGDVFFKTYSSLVSQDPGLLDLYDARVDGGFSPPPGEEAECIGEKCQPSAQTPEHPAAPQSSTFIGPGNGLAPPGGGHCPKGKRKTKRKGKVACVRSHSKHGHHKKGRVGK
jgi:hypothetical protein